jgi:hypothetical protein
MNQEKKVVKISDVIENQIPEFILDENPNFAEFLKQYYLSQEFQGGVVDLAENIAEYKNVDTFDTEKLIPFTTLTADLDFLDEEIYVESTKGFPLSYGLLKIDNEIITYTGITTNTFTGCVRGFSGIDSLRNESNPEFLVFTSTESDSHLEDTKVENLSNLFVREFFKKTKYQFTPGFEELEFNDNVNPQNFISKAKTFYQSKGTDESYRILFKVLFNEDVQIIKPRDFLFTTSDDKWVVTETFVAEVLSGNAYLTKGQTLYQDPDLTNTSVLSASGSIYEIESFLLEGEVYYKIKIFAGYSNNLNPKGSISGTFNSTPKTYLVENTDISSGSLIVDSTVGFPKSGILLVGEDKITYTDKTNNQFLNVSSTTLTSVPRKQVIFGTNYVYSYEDGDETKPVIMRLNNLMSSIVSPETLYSLEGDPIKVANIGQTESNSFVNSLIYNLPLTIPAGVSTTSITPAIRNYFKEGFSISNGLALVKYNHNLRTGDSVTLFRKETNEVIASNLSVNTNLSNEFSVQQVTNTSILGKPVVFRRNLKKTRATPFTRLFNQINNKFTANVQDSYSDEHYYYLTSNGLPDYEVNPYTREFSFSVNDKLLSGSHNFFSGESVKVVGYGLTGTFENAIGINTGNTYFLTRVSSNLMSLSESRENIGISSISFNEYDKFGNITGAVTSIDLIHSPLYGNQFSSSKLLKKIPKKVDFEGSKVKTQAGPIGIFVNGVEIQSYKSFDKLYFGSVEKLDVLNNGSNYSLVNPPQFRIFNDEGDEDLLTKLIPQMKGTLKELIVRSPGYDYEGVPTITITGGNNTEVATEVKMRYIDKQLEFNATTRDDIVNTVASELRFGKFHGFTTGEAVVYETFGTRPIGIGTNVASGTLLNNSVYYAVNIGAGTSIRLAPTKDDAFNSTNLILFRTTGGGVQRLRSLNKIQVVDKVTIIDGQNLNFEYKKLSMGPDDINIYDNIFTIENHEYVNGDRVVLTVAGTYPTGATEGQIYYVKKIDANSLQLCEDNKLTQIINIDGLDFSTTYFIQYPPIEVNIVGKIRKSGSSLAGFPAEVIPVVEGSVASVRVQRGLASPAASYLGSSNVINYHKKPRITLLEGSDASFAPIIGSDGKLKKVIIKNNGQNYYNNFYLKVNGNGFGAEITPIITAGEITGISIVNPGVGYASTNTTIEVVSTGEDLKVSASLTEWTLNEVTKLGISNLNNGCLFGKKYSLFGNVFGTFFLDANLRQTFNIPNVPTTHSPVIGWAYDGCPIYGPFAFENADGSGNIVRMRSGYTRTKISPSPSVDCIEDYQFTDTGTLDRHNGRFCVTPDYPDGVYAYFCTIDENNAPVFPYVIGDEYNYNPRPENFDLTFNQDLDFNELGILKNTRPYRVEDRDNYYEYFKLLTNSVKPDALILASTEGRVDKIEIIDGGEDYEIGDNIIFDNTESGGSGAFGEVSEVGGVGISSINATISQFDNVVFTSTETGIVGVATTAHNFSTLTYIDISGISTSTYDELEGFRKINVETVVTGLTTSLSSQSVTGLVTSIQVKEPIFSFEIDDFIKIENEKLKVISLDYKNNLIGVFREVGAPAYGIGSTVALQQRRFTFAYPNLNIPITEKDEIYYFNPAESVSLGVSTVTGVGNTLTIYKLGVGNSTTKFVPTGGLFLPNNKFRNGEKVVYTTDSSSIVSNVGILTVVSNLYVVKLTDDIIGLVEGSNQIYDTNNLIKYTSVGIGKAHKLKTVRNVVTGTIKQYDVVVSTGSTHTLSIDHEVNLSVTSGVTTTFVVGYSSITKRLTIDGQINPEIPVYSNEQVVFDLTSPTLRGSTFSLYADSQFRNEYYGNEISGLEVTRTLNDLTLQISENTPRRLYYNIKSNTEEIYPDISVSNNNQLVVNNSIYNQGGSLTSVTDFTFRFSLPTEPERLTYNSTTSSISYNVLTKGIKGPIAKTKVSFGGVGYKKLPLVDRIITTSGRGANLFSSSSTIGRIKRTKVVNTDSIFPTDKTLSPVSKVFSTLKLKDNYEVGQIEIVDGGSGYLAPPTLILYNKTEDRTVSDFSAIAKLTSTSIGEIQILNPGSNLKSTDDQIVPVNNTNGLKIINYALSGGGLEPYEVTFTLETPISGFSTSNPLPFEVGDKIFVENVISSVGSGYNSENYRYVPFTLTNVNPNYASQDAATLRFQLNTNPGVVDFDASYDAKAINVKDLPVINTVLTESEFINSETIDGLKVIDNDNNKPITRVIKLHDSVGLQVGDVIFGESSKSRAEIYKIEDFDAQFTVDTSIPETVGWKDFKGNLSSILQKLPNNDYYQKFAYSLKSRKSFSDWEAAVSDLSHVAGYKKFGDLVIESELPVGLGSTLTVKSDTASTINVTITSESEVRTIANFDTVREEDIDDSLGEYSEYIKFSTKKLSDFILSANNRVLPIDDISNLFDTDNSPFVTVPVDTVDTTDSIVLKYFFFVGSTVSFFGDFLRPQIQDLFVTRNDATINLTSYGYYYDQFTATGSAAQPLGTIDAATSPTNGDEIVINFIPRNIFNSYAIRAVKEVTSTTVGTAVTNFGYVRAVESTVSVASSATAVSNIVYSIPLSECDSGVVFLGISSATNVVQSAFELSFTKDYNNLIRTNIYAEQSFRNLGSVGIATSGSDLIFTYTNVPNIGVNVYTNLNLFKDTNTNPNQVERDISRVRSTSINASGTSPIGISTIGANYCATKYIIEMQKTVGLTTQLSLLQINSVHFEDYSNNVAFGIVGDIPVDELDFETIFTGADYILAFNPTVSANYRFKIYEKSIVNPND